jgi:Glycine rich protein
MINYSITNIYGEINNYSVENYGESLIDFGGGNFDIDNGESENLGYGSIILTPHEDFLAWVDLWGADGGSFGANTVKEFSGLGGYTKVLISFKKDINYTLVAGQAGYFKNLYTHGGGAPGYLMGGQGGGMTGIFINSSYYGKEPWDKNFNSLSRENVLAIAGGGGGKGGTTNERKCIAGSGGGWQSGSGYVSGPSFQDINHNSMIGDNPCNSGNNGGGGGGWVGGKSNIDSKKSDIGASGGSGHIVYKEEYGEQPNNQHWQEVIIGKTKFSDTDRQDIFRVSIDKNKFSIVSGKRDTVNNKYKNIFVPQHGRFIITYSDGSYDKNSYLQEINPYATIS